MLWWRSSCNKLFAGSRFLITKSRNMSLMVAHRSMSSPQNRNDDEFLCECLEEDLPSNIPDYQATCVQNLNRNKVLTDWMKNATMMAGTAIVAG
ncbi:hypothetical protein OH492_28560 [Vibrio chagasii]|nr:hypothetical protein [Vibrio chagasii]